MSHFYASLQKAKLPGHLPLSCVYQTLLCPAVPCGAPLAATLLGATLMEKGTGGREGGGSSAEGKGCISVPIWEPGRHPVSCGRRPRPRFINGVLTIHAARKTLRITLEVKNSKQTDGLPERREEGEGGKKRSHRQSGEKKSTWVSTRRRGITMVTQQNADRLMGGEVWKATFSRHLPLRLRTRPCL